MARMGMDVDLVEQVGASLKNIAHSDIAGLITRIEHQIQNAISHWDGKDAHDFMGWWQQQHKPRLQELQSAIEGLGTSAINNAREQRGVSGH